jgi:hypothetical protein
MLRKRWIKCRGKRGRKSGMERGNDTAEGIKDAEYIHTYSIQYMYTIDILGRTVGISSSYIKTLTRVYHKLLYHIIGCSTQPQPRLFGDRLLG